MLRCRNVKTVKLGRKSGRAPGGGSARTEPARMNRTESSREGWAEEREAGRREQRLDGSGGGAGHTRGWADSVGLRAVRNLRRVLNSTFVMV